LSWSVQYSDIAPEDVLNLTPPEGQEVSDQFGEALKAAAVIIESGVIGFPDRHRFNINLAGHANPDHEPRKGWSNDTISLSISQAS
jgi:hypothetical protein